MRRFSAFIPYLVALVVGAGFYWTTKVPALEGTERTVAIVGIGTLAVLVVSIIAAIFAGRRVHMYHRGRMALTPAVLVFGAYGQLLLLESAALRYLLTIGVMFLVFAYLERLRRLPSVQAAEGGEFMHLSTGLHALSVFFILSFAFGMTRVLYIPMFALAPTVAFVLLFIGFETLRRSGIRARHSLPVAAAFAIMAAELFVGIAFFPTPYFVDAIVVSILYVLANHVALQYLSGEVDIRLLRRQVIAALGLIVLTLSTARWT